MSNPLSKVPPPAALPSFVTQPVPVAAPAAPTSETSPAPPAGASSVSLPPQPLHSMTGTHGPPPPMTGAHGPPPPMAGAHGPPPPTSGAHGLPPPPPMGAASGSLSAAGAGHMSRPKYVPPPELATTTAPGPSPMYQLAGVPGPAPSAAAVIPDSVVPSSSFGGATVDYAQTPVAASASAEAAGTGGQEGWFGWIRDTVQKSEVLSKVAERARSSMDTMITTLDPQMRDLIYSGGDLDVVVASDKEFKVSAVREAFQTVFGKATVIGVPVPGASLVPQPVGWVGGRAAASSRLQALRDAGLVPPQQAVVAVEGFLQELEPERWYDLSLLVLDEPGRPLLSTVTQPTEVPVEWVRCMQAASPADHPQAASGLQLSVGQVAANTLQVSASAWHEVMCGLTRRELLVPAARALAYQYRARRQQ